METVTGSGDPKVLLRVFKWTVLLEGYTQQGSRFIPGSV